MVKAKKGGKARRRGKNEAEMFKRELVYKEEGEQEYAQCVRMLGNGRIEAQCFDGKKRLAHIRGKMQKKVWINAGDIVLLSLRDYQDDKADVVHKYNSDEARKLKQQGHLPESAIINEGDDEDEAKKQNQDGITFGDDGTGAQNEVQPQVRPQQLITSDEESDGELDIDEI